MKWRYNRKLVPRARDMRRDKMTPAEHRLWVRYLEGRTPRWRNQRPFDGYIADFYCPALRLVLEVDGDAHFTPEGMAYDAERTAYLEGLGLHITRVTNVDAMQNLEGVVIHLEQVFQQRAKSLAQAKRRGVAGG